jgi:hypothetical protein
MSTDLGDRIRIFTTVTDEDDQPVEATGATPAITLEVRGPSDDGYSDISSAIVFDPDAVRYSALFTPDEAGVWRYRWRTFGTYVGVDYAEFLVEDHAPELAPALGSPEGYALLQGITLADEDLPKVDLQIKLAAAYVRRRTRQTITLVEDDELVVDGMGDSAIYLPERPVVDVSAVEVDGEVWDAGDDYDWSEQRGKLVSLRGCFPVGYRNVAITYSHGFAVVPLEIQGLVYELARRALDNPAGQAVRSETLGQYSVTYETLVGGISATESAILDDLRLPNGVVL